MKDNLKENKKYLADRYFPTAKTIFTYKKEDVKIVTEYLRGLDISEDIECIKENILEACGFVCDSEDMDNDMYLVAKAERILEELKREDYKM